MMRRLSLTCLLHAAYCAQRATPLRPPPSLSSAGFSQCLRLFPTHQKRWIATAGEGGIVPGAADSSADPLAHAEARPEEGGEDDDSQFDVVEASLQELHDLSLAMIAHLRRRTRYTDRRDLQQGDTLFSEMARKLLLLLSATTMRAMLDSAALKEKEKSRVGVNEEKNRVNGPTWNRNAVSKMHLHAPFAIRHLRADVPERYVAAAQCLRDKSTLRMLQQLCGRWSLHRAQIEEKLFNVLQEVTDLRRKSHQ